MKLLVLLAVVLPGIAQAQMCMEKPEGRKLVTHPSGTVLPNVGTTDLPITTSNAKCRELAQNGFALIHCFWFNEAVRAFRDAVKEDPSCCAAWLGLYAALTQPWFGQNDAESKFAIQMAVTTSGKASDLEQSLAAAMRTRSLDDEKAYETAMRAIIAAHPKAVEPRLLFAGIYVQDNMGNNYDAAGKPKDYFIEVREIIEPVLDSYKAQPGLLHYHIHACEGYEGKRAVESARRLLEWAKGSGHMVHMPGHIFTRVGMYDAAHFAFSSAQKIEEAQAAALSVQPGALTWNYGHNISFQIYNLAEAKRVEEALALAKSRGRDLAMIHWRAGMWKEYYDDVKTWSGNQSKFAEGMMALDTDDLGTAALALKKLGKAKESGDWTNRYMHATFEAELRGRYLMKSGLVEAGISALREAITSYAKIAYEEPPFYVRPPHETLAAELTRLGRREEAEAVLADGLKDRPGSPWMKLP